MTCVSRNTVIQGDQALNTYRKRKLHEWIEDGRAAGRIRDVQTVILAYCMDESEAMAWIADIVDGKITEPDALIFMERALQYGCAELEITAAAAV
jgi:hypothetical protein